MTTTAAIKLNKAEEKALSWISAKIAEKQELPWAKPWSKTNFKLPFNYYTNNTFSGLNLIMTMFFDTPEFATFAAINKVNAKIKKGEKGIPLLMPIDVYFLDDKFVPYKTYKTLSKVDKDKCIKRISFTNYYVWNIESQVEGIEVKHEEMKTFTPILKADCDTLIERYSKDCPIDIKVSDRAYYSPISDAIVLPKREQYEVTEMFYSTAFHEMVHATGHQKRLKRIGIVGQRTTETYAEEELVAEIGAAILNANYGTFDNTKYLNAAYVKGWLKKLKNNPEIIIKAARDSKKAVDYIMKYA